MVRISINAEKGSIGAEAAAVLIGIPPEEVIVT